VLQRYFENFLTMRVALVCPTIGQTQRGYERFFTELFQVMRSHHTVTLFKGGGRSGPQEKVVRHLTRTGLLHHVFRNRLRYPRYHLEFSTFALGLLPYLVRTRFDLVHFIDPPLGRLLNLCRRLTRARYALLFTNAGPISYDCSRWADFTQCISPDAFEKMRSFPELRGRASMVPIGIDSERLQTPANRAEIRAKLRIPADTFVILSIATLNRHHKRVDYLIEEVAQLKGNFLLWIDGSMHPDGDPSLLNLAQDRLGNRCRITHVATEEVIQLYKMADVLVSTALSESFGMAILEALCSGLPVITHNSSHFRWLLGHNDGLINMANSGSLTARLAQLLSSRPEARPRVDPADVIRRFAWPHLTKEYLELYRKAVEAGTIP
jgi:glycosyltransferase involved in cell wall biosynthesis